MQNVANSTINVPKLFKIAFLLAVFTILYNLIEGIVAAYFGYSDESLSLFGFGIDSFIEVISGVGIASMILRIQQNPDSSRDSFEKTALKITGFAFYGLVALLTVTSIYNIWTGHKPLTTFWGVVVSVVSIAVMWALIMGKTKVGTALNSAAILADAQCTKVCVYMSVVLLLGSLIYTITNFAYADSLATMGLAYLSFKEGRECFEKANNSEHCGCDH